MRSDTEGLGLELGREEEEEEEELERSETDGLGLELGRDEEDEELERSDTDGLGLEVLRSLLLGLLGREVDGLELLPDREESLPLEGRCAQRSLNKLKTKLAMIKNGETE